MILYLCYWRTFLICYFCWFLLPREWVSIQFILESKVFIIKQSIFETKMKDFVLYHIIRCGILLCLCGYTDNYVDNTLLLGLWQSYCKETISSWSPMEEKFPQKVTYWLKRSLYEGVYSKVYWTNILTHLIHITKI